MDGALANLARLRDLKSLRVSSWDITGGNTDNWLIRAGHTSTLVNLTGPGCIRHIWMTIAGGEDFYLRNLVLRMYWDDEELPSVECPIGDFFGLGHGTVTYFSSAPLQMFDRAFNCWFPMPFAKRARITVENEGEKDAILYFYVDYQLGNDVSGLGRFHAQWRRQLVVKADVPEGTWARGAKGPVNTTGRDNYVVLEAEGRGHYVGCHISLDTNEPGWWGEGDDMFFIDGEVWPPSLHGTGMEDYFCGAWNFNRLQQTFCTPYYGYHFKGNDDYTGKHSMYRFHIEDPIYFNKSLVFSIEHGHANDRSGDWTSVAYWYQSEPHKPFPPFPAVEDRIPYRFGGREHMRRGKDRRELPVNH
ncbi:MAG: DUF2961 domain-containing protein [Firmicutes bacterium]|nr:DUF2961 domain-containing protein [Bacillota bacterium]